LRNQPGIEMPGYCHRVARRRSNPRPPQFRQGWPIRPRPGHALAVGLLPRSLRPASLCSRPPSPHPRRIEMRLTIAQPFMAGVLAHGHHPKSHPGTAESFANTGLSFVPAGTYLIGLNNDPAINGWAIFAAFPSAVRRGIIVESQTKTNSSPVGAASSVRIPDDVAPNGALSIIDWRCYKDSSPTDLPFAHTPRPNSGRAGQSGPGPAMRWPLAFCPGPCVRPVFAATLQKLFMQRRQGANFRRTVSA